eukprot:6614549-Alexandrium_andersonii.AAC.1
MSGHPHEKGTGSKGGNGAHRPSLGPWVRIPIDHDLQENPEVPSPVDSFHGSDWTNDTPASSDD